MIDEAPGVVASPERIDAWMEVARPGDRFIYATRMTLPVPCKAAAHVRALAQRGLVVLSQIRSAADPDYFHYTARRTSAPTAMTRPLRPMLAVAVPVLVDDQVEIANTLLPILQRFALHGRPCPTDKQLAARAKLSEAAVRDALAALVAAHAIRVHRAPAPTLRQVTIIDTGHKTGLAA